METKSFNQKPIHMTSPNYSGKGYKLVVHDDGRKYDVPIVSIVIPTWQRMLDLVDTLYHIQEQTYPKLEIIVVSDGIQKISNYELESQFDCKVIELGRNWSGLLPRSFGIAPLLVGYLVASGDYIMPWCDDERALVKTHIEKLVNLMETPFPNGTEEAYPDFVYPRVHIWRNGAPDNHENTVIGTIPPRHGQITHYMFKPETLQKFGMPDWNTHPVDWSLVDKWLKNGASYRMLNEVTFEHRLDQ